MGEHPRTSAEITGSWLEGIVPGWPRGDVVVERIGAERGIGGVVSRVRSADGRSVIVKLPIPDQPRSHDGLEREARACRWLRTAGCELGAPETFLAVDGPHTPVLVVEDVAALRPGDDVTGCSLDDARLALTVLGRFHRQWVEHPDLPRMVDDRTAVPFAGFFSTLAPRMAATVPAARRWARDTAGPDAEAVVAAMADRVGDIVGVADGPATLVHRDYRLDNLFFDRGAVVAVDWANLTVGPGAIDVAGFIGRCLATPPTGADLADLMATYRAAAGRAAGASFDADVVLGAWYWLGWAAIVATTMDLGPGPRAVVDTWLVRLTPLLRPALA